MRLGARCIYVLLCLLLLLLYRYTCNALVTLINNYLSLLYCNNPGFAWIYLAIQSTIWICLLCFFRRLITVHFITVHLTLKHVKVKLLVVVKFVDGIITILLFLLFIVSAHIVMAGSHIKTEDVIILSTLFRSELKYLNQVVINHVTSLISVILQFILIKQNMTTLCISNYYHRNQCFLIKLYYYRYVIN